MSLAVGVNAGLVYLRRPPAGKKAYLGITAKNRSRQGGRHDLNAPPAGLKGLAEAYRRWPQYPLLSVSDSQRLRLPDASWTATAHPGVPVDPYRFYARANAGYVPFLGRIALDKRPDRAIDTALGGRGVAVPPSPGSPGLAALACAPCPERSPP